jgi:glycosyltransferase involved in cell wall biosynthesis
MTVATVLIPTFDHGPTLRCSVASVLAQTVRDLELFIIGDGVPDVTRAIVAELAARDDRIRFFDRPKGARHGERHRHEALREARGRVVAYLGDDDLWLPDHLETMIRLLERADLANALPVHVQTDGRIRACPIDIGAELGREQLRAGDLGFSMSCGAHTLEAYRRLRHGWRPAPPDVATDTYFWQQFLEDPACRLASGSRPTMLHFASPDRAGWSSAARVAELEAWAARLAAPGGRERLLDEVVAALFAEAVNSDLLRRLMGSATWRLRARLLRVPGVKTLGVSLARWAGGRRAR